MSTLTHKFRLWNRPPVALSAGSRRSPVISQGGPDRRQDPDCLRCTRRRWNHSDREWHHSGGGRSRHGSSLRRHGSGLRRNDPGPDCGMPTIPQHWISTRICRWPFVDVYDAIDPSRFFFENSLRNGISTVHVMQGNNCVVGGVSRIVHPIGLSPDEMTRLPGIALKMSVTPKGGTTAFASVQNFEVSSASLIAGMKTSPRHATNRKRKTVMN